MAQSNPDLLVIGGGSGGLATAKRAASYGARVLLVEGDRLGGTCVIRGCIPKKLMFFAASYAHSAHDAAAYGWRSSGPAELDWPALVAARDKEVGRLEGVHERLLAEAGVELLHGRARLCGPGSVQVDGREIKADRVLLATGSRPALPTLPGVEHAMTSDGFFELAEQPARAVVVGAGYIAVELAGVLSALGTHTSLVYRRGLPLRGFDEDIRAELAERMGDSGIKLCANSVVEGIEHGDGGLTVQLKSGDQASEITSDVVIYATGRKPNTEGLGLEAVGVATGPQGQVLVDEGLRSNVEGVFAVGDLTGRVMLTPVAIQEGRALADREFGGKDSVMDYEGIPTAVFSEPPIATVGLSEEQARERWGENGVRACSTRFNPLLHSLTGRRAPVFMKLVVRESDDTVVGCHMTGPDAPEIIQGVAVAMKAGATKAQFDATVGIHPSSAEELVTL